LSNDQVREIIKTFDNGETALALAGRYGVSETTIRRIDRVEIHVNLMTAEEIKIRHAAVEKKRKKPQKRKITREIVIKKKNAQGVKINYSAL
jgi:Mor family transcriptional regulator